MGIVRRIVLFVLALLLIVLIPLSVLGYWSHETLLDTDHYVSVVGPLSSEDAIQTQVSTSIMTFLDQLAAGFGGDSAMRQQLIDRQYSNLRPTVVESIDKLMDTQTFQTVWEGVNREAHVSLVQLFEGNAPTDDEGRVIVDLNPVYQELQAALLANGVNVLEGINPAPETLVIPLFHSDELSKSQSYVKLFDRVARFLPFAAVALALIFILLFPKKSRGFLWLGLITAIGMGLIYLLVRVARDATTGAVGEDSTQEAVTVIYDEVTRSLNSLALQLLIGGVAVFIVAFVVGKMRSSRRY